MPVQIRTLRPSLLVALSVRNTGGVYYERTDIETKTTASGAVRSKWETDKTIVDPAAFAVATQTRTKCRTMISRLCAASDFGLLCPQDQEEALRTAIEESRALATAHNASGAATRVEVYALVARVASDDAEAVKAINAEIRGLLDRMDAGIKAGDAEAIRKAATEARAVGAVLTEEAQRKVTAAIEGARDAARQIVKRIQKEGENAATVIAEIKADAIRDARFAFLDLAEPTAVEAAPIITGAVEMAPAPVEPKPEPAPEKPSIYEPEAAPKPAPVPAPVEAPGTLDLGFGV